MLRPAVRLFHDLTQILRLCLPAVFDPKTASAGVLGLLARAADLPDFPALPAHVGRRSARCAPALRGFWARRAKLGLL